MIFTNSDYYQDSSEIRELKYQNYISNIISMKIKFCKYSELIPVQGPLSGVFISDLEPIEWLLVKGPGRVSLVMVVGAKILLLRNINEINIKI